MNKADVTSRNHVPTLVEQAECFDAVCIASGQLPRDLNRALSICTLIEGHVNIEIITVDRETQVFCEIIQTIFTRDMRAKFEDIPISAGTLISDHVVTVRHGNLVDIITVLTTEVVIAV